MSAVGVTSAPRRAADRLRAAGPPGARATVVITLVLVGLSAFLRTRALGAPLWIDEGLSVGIASFEFGEIPGILRQDGSPPLYYLLLSLWIDAFGDSERATHVLSLLFALASIPVAHWAARALFGVRAGWYAAGLATLNPFLTYYAQETRMYAIVAVVGMLVAVGFLKVFADRERRFLPLFAVALAVMIYTHNWALFLGLGTAIAFAMLWFWAEPGDRRGLLRDAAIGYGAVAVLYLPWVPTLLYQAAHTGAPWATPPTVKELIDGLEWLVGGTATGLAILLVAGSGVAALLRAPEAPRRDATARRVAALLAMAASAALLAWLSSQVSPAFANRYFAAFFGPVLLLAALGFAHAGRLGLVGLAVVLALWVDDRSGQVNAKSNVRAVTTMVQTWVTPGDLVVSTHPEQLPLLAYYLPDGLRYATALGPQPDTRIFDWRDATERLRAARPRPTADAMVRSLEPGQELVLVLPIFRTYEWEAPWTRLVKKRSVQWERVLDADERMRRVAVVPVFGYDPVPRGVRAVLYRRLR